MLAYTPLHHLLLAECGFPLVATSGNRSSEPIVTDEHEALARLAGIADLFLVHDRPIVRPVDDSVARIVAGRPQLLRRARGYAPAPIAAEVEPGILALGGHLKTALALSTGAGIVVSQHLGDLDTPEARDAYDAAIGDLTGLHRTAPRLVVRDLHPDYHSTRAAERLGVPVVAVQHHHAHVAACMAEHGLTPPVLGVAWDGTGYGPDGTVWGGEFIRVDAAGWQRVAYLRPFRLPGGEAAIREPRRSALGLLFAAFGRDALAMTDLAARRRLHAGRARDARHHARTRRQRPGHHQRRPAVRRRRRARRPSPARQLRGAGGGRTRMGGDSVDPGAAYDFPIRDGDWRRPARGRLGARPPRDPRRSPGRRGRRRDLGRVPPGPRRSPSPRLPPESARRPSCSPAGASRTRA